MLLGPVLPSALANTVLSVRGSEVVEEAAFPPVPVANILTPLNFISDMP